MWLKNWSGKVPVPLLFTIYISLLPAARAYLIHGHNHLNYNFRYLLLCYRSERADSRSPRQIALECYDLTFRIILCGGTFLRFAKEKKETFEEQLVNAMYQKKALHHKSFPDYRILYSCLRFQNPNLEYFTRKKQKLSQQEYHTKSNSSVIINTEIIGAHIAKRNRENHKAIKSCSKKSKQMAKEKKFLKEALTEPGQEGELRRIEP
uniref:Uncharacterized protein n=1 Tax=Glossina pallidipes TaxID=7398 RepID=A0A1A9ZR54_GLOPL